MTGRKIILAVLSCTVCSPALAQAPAQPSAAAPSKPADDGVKEDTVSTGVARSRDRLDSATSTSALTERDIQSVSARTTTEIFRYLAGVRADSTVGEGNANITIRGLPMASTGSKYVQLQEDGLPVLEYGDISGAGVDMFTRADFSLAQVQSIRGGSASTFASNSPGGVINLVSNTGEKAGGAVQWSSGLDYSQNRVDFDYGSPLGDQWRFHVGGFYRKGDGVRKQGFDGEDGGQIKFNLTRTFEGGYLRASFKYLDDRTPAYAVLPFFVAGTNANPQYQAIPGLDPTRGALVSPYTGSMVHLDQNNQPVTSDLRYGQKSKSTAFGLEGQVTVDGWIITDRFRYSSNSAELLLAPAMIIAPAAVVGTIFAGPGARLSYANGPAAGQAITNPATLNGNGLLMVTLNIQQKLNSGDYLVNDLRASKVWQVAGGELTATGGFYLSRQKIDRFDSAIMKAQDIVGDGRAALVDIAPAVGPAVTQRGYLSFGAAMAGITPARLNVDYDTNAVVGSLNYHIGRLAIGGSLRQDFGSAKGVTYGAGLGGGRIGYAPVDVNGDGVISAAEAATGVLPLQSPAPVNYTYHYLSYSTGINYRLHKDFSIFGRYSRGARVNSDRILFTGVLDTVGGGLAQPDALVDFVQQAEIGAKYRSRHATLNVTGFLAKTTDHNAFFGPIAARSYRTWGLEFEGSYRSGPFQVTGALTYTSGKLTANSQFPQLVGNKPQRQPALIAQAVPTLNFKAVTLGAAVFTTTSSYVQDFNLLKMPGYTTVNPFIEVRPLPQLAVALNVNNLFNVTGLGYIFDAGVKEAGSYQAGQGITGRSVSMSARLNF